MKKYSLLFFILILIYSIHSFAQCFYIQGFETGLGNQIWLDTNQTNNIWQVGKPQKTIFTSANNNSLHAIVTDTINPYPANDTSSFFVINYADGSCSGYKFLVFNYQSNTDTLKDYGFIEYSVNGSNWHNLTDTLYKLGILNSPVLSGNTAQWEFFSCNLSSALNIWFSDTVLFKFTFISDSIQTNKDGWIIDDINIAHVTGVPEIYHSFINSFSFPNPAVNIVTIAIEEKNITPVDVIIIDCFGKKVFEKRKCYDKRIEIDTKKINSGTYFYKLTNTETHQSGAGNFIVTKN